MSADRWPRSLSFDFDAMRKDAEKWRDRAAADGGATDPRAEEQLALLDELDRLRVAVTALGGIVCPRCEGQAYDRGSCGLCGNIGWLDERGEALA